VAAVRISSLRKTCMLERCPKGKTDCSVSRVGRSGFERGASTTFVQRRKAPWGNPYTLAACRGSGLVARSLGRPVLWRLHGCPFRRFTILFQGFGAMCSIKERLGHKKRSSLKTDQDGTSLVCFRHSEFVLAISFDGGRFVGVKSLKQPAWLVVYERHRTVLFM